MSLCADFTRVDQKSLDLLIRMDVVTCLEATVCGLIAVLLDFRVNTESCV